jgi:hypothetical protein
MLNRDGGSLLRGMSQHLGAYISYHSIHDESSYMLTFRGSFVSGWNSVTHYAASALSQRQLQRQRSQQATAQTQRTTAESHVFTSATV